MPKPIIGGPDTPKPQEPRARHGGEMPVKPTHYSPPKGPSNVNDPKGPGLHGTNYGHKVHQGKH